MNKQRLELGRVARKARIAAKISLFLLVFLLGACQQADLEKKEDQIYGYFDTQISFIYYAPDDKDYRAILEESYQHYHTLFDQYHDYDQPNIKTINDQAGLGPVQVDPELIACIKDALALQESYGQKTNIAYGAVLELWHDTREAAMEGLAYELPEEEALEEAARHMDPQMIELTDQTVYLKDPEMRLDLGAFAKGWATEKAAKKLEEAGLKSFIINAGGNVKAVGGPVEEGRTEWNIGIQNPHIFEEGEQEQLLGVYRGRDVSVVTSGDYQRFYEVDGVKYHHIIDPATNYPGQNFLATTIVTQDSALADFLSTEIFLRDYESGRALVDSLDQVEALWVFPDDTIIQTWEEED